MAWKIFNIETGDILKAGFDTEDDAKDWMEARSETIEVEDFDVEEMDEDEEEMLAAQSEEVEEEEEDDYDDGDPGDYADVVGAVSLDDGSSDLDYGEGEELDY